MYLYTHLHKPDPSTQHVSSGGVGGGEGGEGQDGFWAQYEDAESERIELLAGVQFLSICVMNGL